MRKFSQEQGLAAFELEQMLVDYWREVDGNAGRNASAFYTEDCTGHIGGTAFSGQDGVTQYYHVREARNQGQAGAARISRHINSRPRYEFSGSDTVTLSFLLTSHAGFGEPPLMDGTAPVSVSDARLKCRRDEKGAWLICRYEVTPIMVSSEQYRAAAPRVV